MIPKISDETEFRWCLKPHLDRLRTGRHFPAIDMLWIGKEAIEFADLIGEMARFMDEDALALIREAQVRASAGAEFRAILPLEQCAGSIRTGTAGIVSALRGAVTVGHAARVEAAHCSRLLQLVEDMERRVFDLLPRILDAGGLRLADGSSQGDLDEYGLPRNPWTQRDAFLERLSSHLDRLTLSARFMDMDVAWEGDEARDFAILIERMASWIDGEATDLIHEARTLRANSGGVADGLTAEKVRARNQGGFMEVMRPVVEDLHAGSQKGRVTIWSGNGVVAMRELVRELMDRTFNLIPRRILEIREEAERALAQRPAAPGSSLPVPKE